MTTPTIPNLRRNWHRARRWTRDEQDPVLYCLYDNSWTLGVQRTRCTQLRASPSHVSPKARTSQGDRHAAVTISNARDCLNMTRRTTLRCAGGLQKYQARRRPTHESPPSYGYEIMKGTCRVFPHSRTFLRCCQVRMQYLQAGERSHRWDR